MEGSTTLAVGEMASLALTNSNVVMRSSFVARRSNTGYRPCIVVRAQFCRCVQSFWRFQHADDSTIKEECLQVEMHVHENRAAAEAVSAAAAHKTIGNRAFAATRYDEANARYAETLGMLLAAEEVCRASLH
eukprot:SAG11_NODE_2513_length_3267_cov_2.052399_3_plen_132_part_00